MRTHEDLTILLGNASCRRIDVFDIEVEEPERRSGFVRVPRHHRACGCCGVVEDAVGPHRPHVHRAVYVPAKETGVKGPCRLLIVSRKLIPADSTVAPAEGRWGM